jgi:hypothetical protein
MKRMLIALSLAAFASASFAVTQGEAAPIDRYSLDSGVSTHNLVVQDVSSS